MTNEIELISDGDGLALIGDPKAVELFLTSEGLTSTDLDLPRLGTVLNVAVGASHVASAFAAGSGRWVQVTHESAALMAKAKMMAGPADGIVRAIVTGQKGTEHIVQIVQESTTILTNPAVLAGVAGIMSQLAMQQAMKEIGDYLVVIDAKLDDVLRAQKDAALADMIGVGLILDDALTLRADVGRVSEITWSKVQGSSLTIARTQAYALRQLDALAEKMERANRSDERVTHTKKAEREVQQWLAVLARCFQLEDALGVLELDRVMDASPDELERHRIGLRKARQNRLDLIARTTEKLMYRMDVVAGIADDRVLFDLIRSRSVVRSSNEVAEDVVLFHRVLGIEDGRQARKATKWLDAAQDFRDDVFEAGAEGVEAAVKIGIGTADRARALTNRIAHDIAARTRRRDDIE